MELPIGWWLAWKCEAAERRAVEGEQGKNISCSRRDGVGRCCAAAWWMGGDAGEEVSGTVGFGVAQKKVGWTR